MPETSSSTTPSAASRLRPFANSQVSWVPWALAIAIIPFLMIACGGGDSRVSLETTTAELNAVNDSGFAGDVLVTSAGDNRTVVVVALGREDVAEGDFPVAIHEGTCSGLSGNEVYDLEPLRSGFLVQEIPTSIDSLEDRDHALVVFESDARSVYVACAAIP